MIKILVYYLIRNYLFTFLLTVCVSPSDVRAQNPCLKQSSGSKVSFTQYKRVSEAEWNEYYQNIVKANPPGPGASLLVRQGLIPTTHYSYHIEHPTGLNCKNVSDEDNAINQQSPTEAAIGQLCEGNGTGVSCSVCLPNFVKNWDGNCVPCHCNEIGSLNPQCDDAGKCQCKPGVKGNNCDSCVSNFYGLNQNGCKQCNCDNAGSQFCDSITGSCACKVNVDGFSCERCKPGHFNLEETSDFGCSPCFCNGHSKTCDSAKGYGQVVIQSTFDRGTEQWSAQDKQKWKVNVLHNAFTQNLKINPSDNEYTQPIYFGAPVRFLGDQTTSYNKQFNFTLRVTEFEPHVSQEDIIFEGAGLKISQGLVGLTNKSHEFSFNLNERPSSGWIPNYSSTEFITLLSNLTSITIRGTYAAEGSGFLDNVKLMSSRKGASGDADSGVETCICPDGYVGQFCESCSVGYFRESKEGGALVKCIPCDCNGHAISCDQETGDCRCENNTVGHRCEKCADYFYGNPLNEPSEGCKPCPCIDGQTCLQIADGSVVCAPSHVSDIIFPKRFFENRESKAEILVMTSEELENLPEVEFVKQVFITPAISEGIRK